MYNFETAVEFLAKIDSNSDTITMKVPFNSKFIDVIRSLQMAFNIPDLSYFEYLDEDNDIVIVSCEDDLQSVFLYYSQVMQEAFSKDLHPLPLQIFAKCNTPERYPNLTIHLNTNKFYGEKDSHSNNSSSKSNTGSLNEGVFISTISGDNVAQLAHSDLGSISPMSEEARDSGQWAISPSLCEDNVYMIGEIGSGASGKVMRALHTPTHEMIAVKIIDLDMDRDDTIKQQILTELAVLKISKSPYIIEFYGAFFVETAIYICTEFMDGYSLDRYGIINNNILGKLLVLMINGLVYLWTNKIIHRDVKPSNMLINTSGQVKLCDFGISKQLVHSIAKTYTGTVAFMSPERLNGESYRISSDVWSLGVSVFMLATGEHPFVDLTQPVTPAVLMNSIINSNGRSSLIGASRQLSAPMIDFIAHCCAQHADQRLDPITITSHTIYEINCGNHISELSQWVFDHSL